MAFLGRTGATVVFASELRALLPSRLVPNDLDPAGIAGFLASGAPPQGPLTILRQILSLPVDGCEWIDHESLADLVGQPRRWWNFPGRSAGTDPAAVGLKVPVKNCKRRRLGSSAN